MADLRTLLAAVRRRLWRDQLAAAGRQACWGSSASMLLAMALHLAAGPVPWGAVGLALVVPWTLTMLRAGWRRPSDRDCALWADRHLGGASAFTTWLDLGRGKTGTADPRALHWLELWAASRASSGLQLLGQRRHTVRWSRPVLSLLICTTLATLVLTTPDLAPSVRTRAAAPSTPGNVVRPAEDIQQPAAAQLASEMASALRRASMRDTPGQARNSQGPAAVPGSAGDGPQADVNPAGATFAIEQAAAGPASSGLAAGSAAASRPPHATGGGSGREAGDSRDDRADVGDSRSQSSTMTVQRSDIGAQRPAADWQADMERSGTYDDGLSWHGTAAPLLAAAAATPPAATQSRQLSPTETSYVQAWLKASTRRR